METLSNEWILLLALVNNLYILFETISNFKLYYINIDFSHSSCYLGKFDVKNDMIIKTEESKKLGAKFLESADALTKVECLHLCCETENCDVFVYEEKVKIYKFQLKFFVFCICHNSFNIRIHSTFV